MKYKNFEFGANPQTVKASLSKKTGKKSLLFSSTKVQEISYEPATISGSGVFLGDEAPQNVYMLMHTFEKRGADYLFVPGLPPVKAFFTSLEISQNAQSGGIEYSFVFTEEHNQKRESFDFGYTYAESGENLYDVANRTQIPVQTLFECNDFCDLFSLNEGDRIWLR